MNIKNLFLLLLLLVSFAACSSDNDEIEEKDAPVLFLDLKPVGGVATKADYTTFTGENDIKTYSVLVFNADGTALLDKRSGQNETQIRVTGLDEGDVVNVVAFVNLSDNAKKAVDACGSLEDLPAVIETIANQTGSQLTMASMSAVRREIAAGTNNIDVSLVRLVSRIQVSSISTNFKIANDYKVTISDLKLLQVKTSSYLYGSTSVEVDKSQQQDIVMFNAPTEKDVWNVSNTEKLTIKTDGTAPAESEVAMPYAYAFENTNSETPTQLLLTATLWDNTGKVVSTRNFKVTIHGKASASHTYLKRNYIYDLGLSFEDTSFDMAALVVKVTVVPWGKVKQESEVD